MARKKKYQRPPASKVVSLVVSVGPGHDHDMDDFVGNLCEAVQLCGDGKDVVVTVNQASYVPVKSVDPAQPHARDHYRAEEWEGWDGDPAHPPVNRWEVARNRGGNIVVERKPRSPREALDDLYEYLERERPTVQPRVFTPGRSNGTVSGSSGGRRGPAVRRDDDGPQEDLFADYR